MRNRKATLIMFFCVTEHEREAALVTFLFMRALPGTDLGYASVLPNVTGDRSWLRFYVTENESF